MYVGWGQKRNMQTVTRELAGVYATVIGGFGAARELGREHGLHVLESDQSGRSVARVRVAPLNTTTAAADIPAAELLRALASSPATAGIVRRYRTDPSPLVRDTERGWRTGRLDDVLAGDFDLFTPG